MIIGNIYKWDGIFYRLKRLHGNIGTFQRLNPDGSNYRLPDRYRGPYRIPAHDGTYVFNVSKLDKNELAD